MAKKGKKGAGKKGKKEKKEKPPKVEKIEPKLSELYQQISETNAELAAVWSEALKVEDEKLIVEKELEELRTFLEGTKEYLVHATKEEGDWVADLDGKLSILRARNDTQTKYYEDIINGNNEEVSEELKKQETQIANIKVTLQILSQFEDQRQAYLKRKEELDEQEAAQAIRHKNEVYEEEKKIRLEKVPLKKEMNFQLKKLIEPLHTIMSSSQKDREKLKDLENAKFLQVIGNLSDHYKQLIKTYEQVSKEADDAVLNVSLIQDRIELVESEKEVGKLELNVHLEGDLLEESTRRSLDKTEVSVPRSLAFAYQDVFSEKRRSSAGSQGYLEELESMILNAIDIQETQGSEDDDVKSITESVINEALDHQFQKREDLLNAILNYIDDTLTERRLSISMTKPPKIKRSTPPKLSTMVLKRCELYKTLSYPKKKTVDRLKRFVPLHLEELCQCINIKN